MSLTAQELKKVIPILESLEGDALRPFKHFSGGFATAEMFGYDEDLIDIEITSGVQSDCESKVYTEQLAIDRKTMKLIT